MKILLFTSQFSAHFSWHTFVKKIFYFVNLLGPIAFILPSNILKLTTYLTRALREKCLNTEFFLVRIFLYSDWIRRDTPYLSIFSPNTGKYGPEITSYLDTIHAVVALNRGFCQISRIKLFAKIIESQNPCTIF